MQLRFLLVSGKTLEEVIEMLNNSNLNYARIVYWEKAGRKYRAVIDTAPLHVITYGDLQDMSIAVDSA